MVEPWDQWDRAMDPRPERRPSRRRGPMPVNSRWLRRIFPLTEDVEESMQALKLVSEAGLNESKPIDASSAEGGEGGTEGGPRSWQKLQVSWAKLLKQAHRKCAGAVMTELGPVKLEPIYPDVQVQEEFLSAQKKYQGVIWDSSENVPICSRFFIADLAVPQSPESEAVSTIGT